MAFYKGPILPVVTRTKDEVQEEVETEAAVMARCRLAQTMALLMLNQDGTVRVEALTQGIWVQKTGNHAPGLVPLWVFRVKLWVNSTEINITVQLREEEYPGLIAKKIYHGMMFEYLNKRAV